jgi:hypothetical protein
MGHFDELQPALAISPLPLPPPPPNSLPPLSNPGMNSSSARNSLRRARHPRCWWSFTTPCRPRPRPPRRRQSYRSRTPRASYSSSGSPSASSSGPAAMGLAPTAVKTEDASPGRSRTRKPVMGSFDAETRWPNEWSINAHMFDPCA